MHDIKVKLLQAAKDVVAIKIKTANTAVTSAQESKLNETKSSAGDKFETGRAMMQVEQEKAEMQLSQSNHLMSILNNLKLEKPYDRAALGSLVITAQHSYFLSIGIGKLVVEGKTYYAISELSPIGKLLIGKQEKETIQFREQTITLNKIS